MDDNKLAVDEGRRLVQHESIKSQVESDVNAEIATRAERTTPSEAQKMEQVAGDFRVTGNRKIWSLDSTAGEFPAKGKVSFERN